MSISRVAGQMLQSNLQRDGVNLSFSNLDLGNSTPTLYLDVGNNRVGVNKTSASVALDVVGSANITANVIAGNVVTSVITNTAGTGNISLITTGIGIVNIAGTNGVIIPAGNTLQRPSPPVTGTLRLNTGLNQLEVWDGTINEWLTSTGGGGNVTIIDQQIIPDGVTSTYTLDQSTDSASILVTLNGVGQIPTVAYTVVGNQITFAQTPVISDIIDIRFLAGAISGSAIYNTTGNTSVHATDATTIVFKVADANVTTITTAGVFNISSGHSLQLPVYTVAQASALANVATGQVIYVSNGDTGNPCLAVYSGNTFKRVALGSTIST